MNTTLKQKLPPDRSYEQILNHYLVEKSIAEKLKASDRDGRKMVFSGMYDELFAKVPDHPRLTRRKSDEMSKRENRLKFRLINRFLKDNSTFVEFAPGDCRFAVEVAKKVRNVFGVDISDQRDPSTINPENFRLIVYDGYNLPEIKQNTIDIVFSYQLIEHLHPEDTQYHFELVRNILKPGGKYVFQTPHATSGPYDISMFFSDEPEGFHLKEWTYTEVKALVKNLGFSSFQTRFSSLGIDLRLPCFYFYILERILTNLPKRRVRKISKRLIPMLYAVAIK